jgi:hypothetical protein
MQRKLKNEFCPKTTGLSRSRPYTWNSPVIEYEGRTLPPASIVFLQMKEDFKRFEKALAPSGQRALEELLVFANKHIAETQFASSPFPEDIFMLAILLELHKEVMELEMVIEQVGNNHFFTNGKKRYAQVSSGPHSIAPMSQVASCGRAEPRWSVVIPASH